MRKSTIQITAITPVYLLEQETYLFGHLSVLFLLMVYFRIAEVNSEIAEGNSKNFLCALTAKYCEENQSFQWRKDIKI